MKNVITRDSDALAMTTRSRLHINQLPEELLRGVFLRHVSRCRGGWSKFRSNNKRKPYHWLRITFVCRHWRITALEMPVIWTHIVTTHPVECIQTMLERSRPLPITVNPSLSDLSDRATREMSFTVARLILEELYRIQDLEFEFREADIIEVFNNRPPSQLILKRLNLSCDLSPHRLSQPSFESLRHSSHLTHLTLNITSWDQAKLLFCPTMQVLDLTLADYVAAPRMLEALNLMPFLTQFKIDHEGAMPNVIEALSETRSIVYLPRLECYDFTGMIEDCNWLLNHLSFPPSARIYVDVAPYSTQTATATEGLTSSIASKLYPSRSNSHTNNELPLLTFAIEQSVIVPCVEILGWRSVHTEGVFLDQELRTRSSFHEPTVGLHIDTERTSHEFLLEMMRRYFTLNEVRSLSIHRLSSLEIRPFLPLALNFIRSTPLVHTLAVYEWTFDDLSAFLLHEDQNGDSEDNLISEASRTLRPFILPSLHTLVVEHPNYHWGGSEETGGDLLLHEALKKREPSYGCLKRLVVESNDDSC
ncbi:unnamed protein product [Somion occarium]